MRLSTEVLIGEARIAERVEALARAISADTPEDTRLSVLAIMDGAFMFCADLVRRLPMPVQIGLVRQVSVDRGGDPARLRLPDDFRLDGADLLVVEDILDSGRTMTGLLARLAGERPRRVRLAVLLDKPSRRVTPVEADYVGFTVGKRWVVGYGLDHDGLYRNLPYITYVE